MYKNLRWKLLTILAVAAIAIVAFYPPQTKIHLGLDLKGGLQLILQVKTEDALRVETETSSEQLKAALAAQGIAEYLKDDGSPAPPNRVPVSIRVTGGTLSLVDADTGHTTRVEGIAAEVNIPASRADAPPRKGRTHLSIKSPAHKLPPNLRIIPEG